MSVSVTTNEANTQVSRLISAVNMGIQSVNTSIGESAQFGFTAIIETPSVVINNNDFDFEFTIPFDDDMVANESEIIVYNLSNSTSNKFKIGNTLSITAGYNNDTGIILSGWISDVKTVMEGVDRITTVKVLDDIKYTSQLLEEKTYSGGIKASQILKDLLDKLGLTIAVFNVSRDHIYENETKVDGSITENIKTYSDVCGVSTYIYKQQIYCRPITEGDNLHFTVNEKTGMIESPSPFQTEESSEEYTDTVTGYEVSMLLQHRIATAGIVNLSSVNYSGEFRISEGKHSFDGLSATTEFKCIEKITTTIDTSKINNSNSNDTPVSESADKLIQVAENEIGTSETGDNNNKYGRDLGQNGVPWCGIFVAWCLKQAGFGMPPFNNYASALSYAYAAQHDGWGTYHAKGSGYAPKRGDIFVVNYDGTAHRDDAHVGLVRYNSDGDTFVTVEGNSLDKVNTRTLNVSGYTFVTPPI